MPCTLCFLATCVYVSIYHAQEVNTTDHTVHHYSVILCLSLWGDLLLLQLLGFDSALTLHVSLSLSLCPLPPSLSLFPSVPPHSLSLPLSLSFSPTLPPSPPKGVAGGDFRSRLRTSGQKKIDTRAAFPQARGKGEQVDFRDVLKKKVSVERKTYSSGSTAQTDFREQLKKRPVSPSSGCLSSANPQSPECF